MKISYNLRIGGCSSIGRASPCGGECCGFKSRQSPKIKSILQIVEVYYLVVLQYTTVTLAEE